MTAIAMPMGRPPKPNALKRLEGSRHVNPSEPQPSIVPQDPPDYLDETARQEWERVFPELYRLGIATTVDRVALAAYCQAFSDWIAASEAAAANPRVIETPNGALQSSPFVTQARQARADVVALANQFGFTPASRARLSVRPASPEDEGETLLQ